MRLEVTINENEYEDFRLTAKALTGGGFRSKYDSEIGKIVVWEIDPSYEAGLLDWKLLPEYIDLKREQKLALKYQKELAKLIWGEVKKDKDGDLTPEDIAEVDKKLEKL